MRPSLVLGGAGALALALLLLPAAPVRRISPPAVPLEPPAWVVGLAQQDAGGVGPAMPLSPFERQRRPPCAATQEEHSGGCWYRLAQRPPCGGEQYELGGACFLPVFAAPRPPVGTQP